LQTWTLVNGHKLALALAVDPAGFEKLDMLPRRVVEVDLEDFKKFQVPNIELHIEI